MVHCPAGTTAKWANSTAGGQTVTVQYTGPLFVGGSNRLFYGPAHDIKRYECAFPARLKVTASQLVSHHFVLGSHRCIGTRFAQPLACSLVPGVHAAARSGHEPDL